MDNSESAASVREMLLKVLTGDKVSASVLHTLAHLGLIKKRGGVKKKVDIEAWIDNPVAHFELTAKGLRRIKGE